MLVRYIYLESNGSSANSGNHLVEVQAVDAIGINRASGKGLLRYSTLSYGSPSLVTDGVIDSNKYVDLGTDVQYAVIDLGAVYDISYIKVWRYYSSSRYYKDVYVKVSEDDVTYTTVFSSAVDGTYYETSEGKQIDLPLSEEPEEPVVGFYYAGEFLPEIPQKVRDTYKYLAIRKNVTRGYYDLLASNEVPYFDSGLYFGSGSGASVWYQVPLAEYCETDVLPNWALNKSNTGWYTIDSTRILLWSNTTIPNNQNPYVAYLYGSEPSKTTVSKSAEANGTSLTVSMKVVKDMWVLAAVSTRSDTTYPSDWTLLHESTVFDSSVSQRMAIFCKKAEQDGDVTLTVSQATSARIYVDLVGIKDIKGFAYHDGSEHAYTAQQTYFTLQRPEYKSIIWCCSGVYWADASTWTCLGLPVTPISLGYKAPARQALFIDSVTGTSRVFCSTTGASTTSCIDYVEVLGYAVQDPSSGTLPDTPNPPVDTEGLYSIEAATLTEIADAIRTKTGKTDSIEVPDMPEEILSIQSGGGSTPDSGPDSVDPSIKPVVGTTNGMTLSGLLLSPGYVIMEGMNLSIEIEEQEVT